MPSASGVADRKTSNPATAKSPSLRQSSRIGSKKNNHSPKKTVMDNWISRGTRRSKRLSIPTDETCSTSDSEEAEEEEQETILDLSSANIKPTTFSSLEHTAPADFNNFIRPYVPMMSQHTMYGNAALAECRKRAASGGSDERGPTPKRVPDEFQQWQPITPAQPLANYPAYNQQYMQSTPMAGPLDPMMQMVAPTEFDISPVQQGQLNFFPNAMDLFQQQQQMMMFGQQPHGAQLDVTDASHGGSDGNDSGNMTQSMCSDESRASPKDKPELLQEMHGNTQTQFEEETGVESTVVTPGQPVDKAKVTRAVSSSELFCTVPGRLSILGLARYKVTVAELRRRISAPECLNSSVLAALVRMAKTKQGGLNLRDQLANRGLVVPAGRRKAGHTNSFTGLLEEEAVQLANDTDAVTREAWPAVPVATHLRQQMAGASAEQMEEEKRDTIGFIRHMQKLRQLLGEVHTPIGPSNPPVHPDHHLQIAFNHYSIMTHGFGILNQRTWVNSFLTEAHVYLNALNQY